MRAQDKTNLVKVGMFVTALSIVMMILIVAIGKESSLFSPKSTIRARVVNAENLKTGAVVELKGTADWNRRRHSHHKPGRS